MVLGTSLSSPTPADIDDFASGMATLAGECPGSSDHMSWERVVELFPKISNWLIIPHYKKSKKLDSATLSHIQSTTGYDALEVANAKKGSLSAMGRCTACGFQRLSSRLTHAR